MLDRHCVRNVKPLTCRAKRAAIANAPNTPESIHRSLARPTIMDTAMHPHQRQYPAHAPVRPHSARRAPNRAIEEMESVIIRFVGDSGDGMQLTGDGVLQGDRQGRPRFRHSSRLPVGDPRADRHALRRLRLPDPVLLGTGVHLGRRARRAGGHEPGGAQDQSRRRQARRHDHRQQRRLHRGQPGQGRVQEQSARGRQPRRLSHLSASTSPSSPPTRCRTPG